MIIWTDNTWIYWVKTEHIMHYFVSFQNLLKKTCNRNDMGLVRWIIGIESFKFKLSWNSLSKVNQCIEWLNNNCDDLEPRELYLKLKNSPQAKLNSPGRYIIDMTSCTKNLRRNSDLYGDTQRIYFTSLSTHARIILMEILLSLKATK